MMRPNVRRPRTAPTLETLEGRALQSGLAAPAPTGSALLLPCIEQDGPDKATAEPTRPTGGGQARGIIAILIGL